jgi:hypothetical protein
VFNRVYFVSWTAATVGARTGSYLNISAVKLWQEDRV